MRPQAAKRSCRGGRPTVALGAAPLRNESLSSSVGSRFRIASSIGSMGRERIHFKVFASADSVGIGRRAVTCRRYYGRRSLIQEIICRGLSRSWRMEEVAVYRPLSPCAVARSPPWIKFPRHCSLNRICGIQAPGIHRDRAFAYGRLPFVDSKVSHYCGPTLPSREHFRHPNICRHLDSYSPAQRNNFAGRMMAGEDQPC